MGRRVPPRRAHARRPLLPQAPRQEEAPPLLRLHQPHPQEELAPQRPHRGVGGLPQKTQPSHTDRQVCHEAPPEKFQGYRNREIGSDRFRQRIGQRTPDQSDAAAAQRVREHALQHQQLQHEEFESEQDVQTRGQGES